VQKLKTAREAAIISVSCKNDDYIHVGRLIHGEILPSFIQQGQSEYEHDGPNQEKPRVMSLSRLSLRDEGDGCKACQSMRGP